MARQSKGKKQRKDIYIFTEGETEKIYFNSLKKKYNLSMTIKTYSVAKFGMELLNHAIGKINNLSKNKKKNLGNVYIIFDKDDLAINVLQQVLTQAQSHGISIGFSNCNFEIWLLSHFEKINFEVTKDILNNKLSEYLSCQNYVKEKSNAKLLEQMTNHVAKAMENCQNFDVLEQPQLNINPYTNLAHIIQEIYQQKKY